MKAHVPAAGRLSKKQMTAIREAAGDALRRQEQDHIRRIFKLLCVALHESYGFGRRRLQKVLETISRTAQEADADEVYWAHVDRVVIDELQIDFVREETE